MYRALITDLDGTAVPISSDGSDVSRQTTAVLQDVYQKGKKVACATGREWSLAGPVIRALQLNAACIIEGGTRIVHPKTGDTLWEKHFSRGVATQILSVLKSVTDQGSIVSSDDLTLRSIADVETMPDNARFIYILGIPEHVGATIVNQVNARLNAVAHETPSWSGAGFVDVHITDKRGTKEHAIVAWHKIEGITKSETIGMGDSGNDIPLFNASGLKVAVGNASPALKSLADYIAPSVDDGALQHVAKKFL